MAKRYITAAGIGDGSSWPSAAPLSALDTQCVFAGPGGEVLLDSTKPFYNTSIVSLSTNVGTSTARVTVRGANPLDDRPDFCTIVGNRPFPFNSNIASSSIGSPSPCFQMRGASNVAFDHIAFRNIGRGCFATSSSFPTPTDNCLFTNIRGFNVQLLVLGNTGAPFTNCTFRNIKAKGFSKHCLQFNTLNHDILIEDFYLDGDFQYNDSFSSGITIGNSTATAGDGVFNGTTTFTSASSTFTSADTGSLIYSSGNVAAGTTVTFVDAHTLTLSQAALTSTTTTFVIVNRLRNQNITIRNGTIKNINDWHFIPARTKSDGVTSGTNLTSATGGFSSSDIGSAVTGAVFSNPTFITVVNSSTSVTLNTAATSNASGVTFTITGNYDEGTYFNADGIASERCDDNILVEDVYFENITDGACDMKGSNFVGRRITARNIKRTFRIWHHTAKLYDCASYQPKYPKGNGGSCHLFVVDNGIHWYGGTMNDDGIPIQAITADDPYTVNIENCVISQTSGGTFASSNLTVNEMNNRHVVQPLVARPRFFT